MEPDVDQASAEPLLVVAAVFVRAGAVLACRRAPGHPAAGRWEFPGGKIESDETAEQALRRELTEELSVTATIGPLVDRTRTQVGSVIIDLACYLIDQHYPDPVAGTDHDQLRWQPRSALHELDWAAPDLPAVHRLATEAFNC